MKNANMRDELATKYDIICYEMEAVGVMETTSCLTIRGISDYADGHKNDDWHSYASLSAAVCSKELLKIISTQSISQCPMEITQEELFRSVRGAVHQVNCSMHQSTRPEKEYQIAERNLDTIVERYGLVQNLIVPELYGLTQGSSPEALQGVRDKVAAMETLQSDLEESLESLRDQVRKQSKRRDSNFVTREDWKALKGRIDERARWVAEVSNTTHRILKSTAWTSGRFFRTVGQKGNKTFQNAGHVLQDSTQQALEKLKALLDQFKHHFGENRNGSSGIPPGEGRPSENLTSRENITQVKSTKGYYSPKVDVVTPASSSTQPSNTAEYYDIPAPLSPPPPPPLIQLTDNQGNSRSSPCLDSFPPNSFSNLSTMTVAATTIPPPRRPPPPPPPRGFRSRQASEDRLGHTASYSSSIRPRQSNEDERSESPFRDPPSLRHMKPQHTHESDQGEGSSSPASAARFSGGSRHSPISPQGTPDTPTFQVSELVSSFQAKNIMT